MIMNDQKLGQKGLAIKIAGTVFVLIRSRTWVALCVLKKTILVPYLFSYSGLVLVN